MEINLGTGDLAKYPFLNEVSQYIRDTHFSLEEFDRPDMTHILERATNRISLEMDGTVYLELERYEVEVMTFLVCLVIVKNTAIESIIKKFSLYEAMRTEHFLKNDLKEYDEKRINLLLSKIFREIFKINIIKDNPTDKIFKMSIADYLSRSSQFHEREWKLINRSVNGGYVFLDVDETVRLIRNELSLLIYKRIKEMNLPVIPHSIQEKSDLLKTKFIPTQTKGISNRTINQYPPCVARSIDLMRKNENLPHSARFLVATYLLSIGKEIEEIVSVFKNAPDYNEKITMYQIEHLSGKKGNNTKYSVPSCSKLRTENLCFPDVFCNGITNPIQYKGKYAYNSNNQSK